MKSVLTLIRCVALLGCLFLALSGNYPPAIAQDRESEAVQAERIRGLEGQISEAKSQVTSTNAQLARQWEQISVMRGQLDHIQGMIELGGWIIGLAVAGGLALQVRGQRDTK